MHSEFLLSQTPPLRSLYNEFGHDIPAHIVGGVGRGAHEALVECWARACVTQLYSRAKGRLHEYRTV